MGIVYAEIELISSTDLSLAKRKIIGEEEVKKMRVTMMADSGAYYLCINETIQEQLDLPFIEKRKIRLVNGHVEEYNVVGPIVVKFKNRQTVCNALVLQGDSEPLLGSIPLQDMDVLIHPLRQELIVNPDRPYYAQVKLKSFSIRASSFDNIPT